MGNPLGPQGLSSGLTRRQFLGNTAKAAAVVTLGSGLSVILEACGVGASSAPKASSGGATGTAGPTTAVAASAGPLTSVKFQQSWLLDVEFAGLYAAIEKGFFKNYGLDVTPVPGGVSVDPRTLVSAGTDLLGSVSEGTDEVLGISNGADYKAIAAVYQQNPGCLMVKANSGINSVKDLVGKSIGIQNPARQQILAILSYNNINPSQVSLVTVGSDPSVFAAGKVDAWMAFAFNEPVAMALQGIQTKCFSYSEIGLPAYGDAIIAKNSTIQQQPDLLAKFVKGLQQGWQYTIDHTDEMLQFSLKDYAKQADAKQQTDQIKVEIPMLTSSDTQAHGLLWMDTNVWQKTIDFMSNAKLLGKAVTVDDVMTMDILNRAAALS